MMQEFEVFPSKMFTADFVGTIDSTLLRSWREAVIVQNPWFASLSLLFAVILDYLCCMAVLALEITERAAPTRMALLVHPNERRW